ncbi:unnamed protein product, partial [marine sediment metagenome]
MGLGVLFGGAAIVYTRFYMTARPKTVIWAHNTSIVTTLGTIIAGLCLKLKTKFPEDPEWLRKEGKKLETEYKPDSEVPNPSWSALNTYRKDQLKFYFTNEELNALFFTKDAQNPDMNFSLFSTKHGLPDELNDENKMRLTEKFATHVESYYEKLGYINYEARNRSTVSYFSDLDLETKFLEYDLANLGKSLDYPI